MFTGLWLLSSLLYNSGIINYAPASTELLLLLFTSFSFFYTGYYLFWKILPSDMHVTRPTKKISQCEDKSIELVFYFVFGLLAVRALSVAFGLYFRYGGVSAIFINGDLTYELTRTGQWAPGIPVVLPVEMLSAFFVAYRYIKTKRFDYLSWAVIFFILLVTTFLQSRYMLIMSFFAFIALLVCSNHDVRLVTPSRVSLFFTILIMITLSRGLSSTVEGDIFGGLAIAGEIGSIVYYISSGLAGLNEYLRLSIDEYSSLYSLNGLANIIELVSRQSGLAMTYEEITYYTPTPTIVATALKFLFDDFGYFCIFVFFILGSITRYLLVCSKRLQSTTHMFLFSILYIILGYSFFGWSLFIGGFWMYMISGALLLLFTRSNALKLFLNK